MLPSYREGFLNAVLQDGAMNLPNIIINISGCNEIIEDNVNGFLVPSKKNIELEEVLHNLFINRNLINSTKENLRRIIQDKFDKDIV